MTLAARRSCRSIARPPRTALRSGALSALGLLLLAPLLVQAQGFSSISSNSSAAPAGSGTTQANAAPATAPPPGAPTAPANASAGTPSRTAPTANATPLASLAFNDAGGSVPQVGSQAPLGTATPAPRYGSNGGSFEPADRVVVDKGDRRLYLLRQDRVIAEYPVKLGLNPYGHKQQEGDFRTPEGKYQLVRRNPRSEFFLAIQVSYPNREDMAWAKENGRKPGGLIMIHGQPNVPRRPSDFYANRDWTDGCIALTNADMVDVWLRTTVGTSIEIRP